MFAPFCPEHGSRVLLSTDQITGVRTTPLGIEISYRYHCGHDGVELSRHPEALPAA